MPRRNRKTNHKAKPAKSGNRQMAVDFQELRRSSAASPHRNRKRYYRPTDKDSE